MNSSSEVYEIEIPYRNVYSFYTLLLVGAYDRVKRTIGIGSLVKEVTCVGFK